MIKPPCFQNSSKDQIEPTLTIYEIQEVLLRGLAAAPPLENYQVHRDERWFDPLT
jgi:hypothetical protein